MTFLDNFERCSLQINRSCKQQTVHIFTFQKREYYVWANISWLQKEVLENKKYISTLVKEIISYGVSLGLLKHPFVMQHSGKLGLSNEVCY